MYGASNELEAYLEPSQASKRERSGQIVFALIKLFHHSVHPHPFLLGGREGLNLSPKKGVPFFRGWGRVQFLDKNKLKSGILNAKKSL